MDGMADSARSKRWSPALRLAVGLVGLVLLAGGIALLATDTEGAWMLVLCGAVLFFGLGFERIRYKPLLKKTPGAGWQRTTERFIDEETAETVTVYVDPVTGERAYVRE